MSSFPETYSEIHFKIYGETSVSLEMKLSSSHGIHFMKNGKDGTNNYLSQMGLRDGDKLIGINYKPLDCYDHQSVLEMLHKLFCEPPKEAPISLVVVRHVENSKPDVQEILIQVDAAGWLKFGETVSKVLPIGMKSSCVECGLSTTQTRMISTTGGDDTYYVYRDKTDEKLKISKGKNNGNYLYDFVSDYQKNRESEDFYVYFKSKDSNYYIHAPDCSTLDLSDRVATPPDLNSTDPRVFIVSKESKGVYTFKSKKYQKKYWKKCTKTLTLGLSTDKTTFKLDPPLPTIKAVVEISNEEAVNNRQTITEVKNCCLLA